MVLAEEVGRDLSSWALRFGMQRDVSPASRFAGDPLVRAGLDVSSVEGQRANCRSALADDHAFVTTQCARANLLTTNISGLLAAQRPQRHEAPLDVGRPRGAESHPGSGNEESMRIHAQAACATQLQCDGGWE